MTTGGSIFNDFPGNQLTKTCIYWLIPGLKAILVTDNITQESNTLVSNVELAGLPAPPTSHTLYLYPFHPSLPFPFPNYTAGNLEILPDLPVSNPRKETKVT